MGKTKKNKVDLKNAKIIKIQPKYVRLIVIILVLSLILLAILLFANSKKPSSDNNNKVNGGVDTKNPISIEKLKVYDEESNQRPYAVMIPNAGNEKKRHYGIQNAYLTYEIIVEGGLTRLMALFKDTEIEKVGPIRSSRHYFLDYVLENDALYIHWGGSQFAYGDIKSLNIDNLDGMGYDDGTGRVFWRDKNYNSPSNGFISTEKIKKEVERQEYRITSDDYQLLNYSTKKVDLSNDETFKEANNIIINYPGGAYVKYEYDEENEYYLRYNNETKYIDNLTNEQVHVKNIIVLNIENESIVNDSSGRQNLNNIGNGKGYYISNGQSIEITWSKKSRTSKTIFKDLSGKEIKINDGNTFIQVQPLNKTTTIE